MTDSLAPADPDTTRFEATVERVDADSDASASVVLDETYFYPEGGGQPADRGTVARVDVVDVRERDGEVVHALAESGVDPGDRVACRVDDAFRTYCARAHTASHALYGAGRRVLDDLGYAGFDIGEQTVRVDLATPTDIDDDRLVELERLTNRAVWDSRPVTWETVPRAAALDREGVAFNAKTEEGIGDDVRLVEIAGWDVAACGGTHVSNTREIGLVSVLDRSNPGEGRTRVEFAVGPEAVDRRATGKRAAFAAARALDTGVEGLPDEVDRLRADRDELAAEVEDLTDRLVGARLDDLRDGVVDRDGETWLVGAVPALDANGLADRATDLAGDDADVVALVDADGTALAVASEGRTDASDVVDRVTDEFGGGGGGRPESAQAGGLGADAPDVVAFLGSD